MRIWETGTSDLKKIREKLSEPVEPESFGFNGNVPDYYSRMKSVESALKKKALKKHLF